MSTTKEKAGFEVEIRSCKKEDLEEVYAIERGSFPTPWSRFLFENLLLRSSGDFLVAVDGETVVGYAIAIVERNFEFWGFRFGERGHLLNIAVEKGKRRRGIGTSLLRAIIDRLRKKDIADVWLEVRARNVGARKFYQDLGFQESGLVNHYYLNGDDAVIMTRRL